MDQKLSLDIDRMLAATNVYWPTQLQRTVPDPLPPPHGVEMQSQAHLMPIPPRLPQLDFGASALLRDDSSFATLSPSPNSPSLVYTPRVPKWCPSIPALTGALNTKELPLFFDLSSLPESPRAPPMIPGCRELQLRQLPLRPQPTKCSRFFSPRTDALKPAANLPVTSCILQKSDKGVQVDLSAKPISAQQAVNTTELLPNDVDSTVDEEIEASAANLWRILTSKDKPVRSVELDPSFDSFATKDSRDSFSMPHRMFDTRMASIWMPAELEGDQTPFPPAELDSTSTTYITAALDATDTGHVHANSLTGKGNERTDYPQREIAKHRTVICDSTLSIPPTEDIYTGLNDMVVDHDFYDDDEKRYWNA